MPFPVFADFSQSVLFPTLHMPRLDDRGLGVGHFHDSGFFSSSFTAFSPRIQYAPFRQKDAKHPLPLPLGEVDERSEDGEGN